MKNVFTLLFSTLLIAITFSCKKEGCTDETANNYDAEAKKDNGTCTYDPVLEIPTVETVAAYFITDSSAISGGNITNDGGTDILTTGICWSTNPNPTIDDNFINGGVSLSFDLYMSGLTENSVYYARAFASNSVGLSYGNEINFTTIDVILPTVSTNTPTLSSVTSIIVGGNITNTGNGLISERGVCWSTSPNPTINDNVSIEGGTSSGLFSTSIYNTQSETTYYIRAYAKNQAGISYGQEEVYVNPHISFIGEYYQGGVVFYISGEHGLICSINNQSYNAQWGCQVVTGATDNGLFAGESSTQLILDQCTTPGIAAVLCRDYSYGGYSDWFLPSGQEFNLLYNNKTIVNTTLSSNGGDIIDVNSYWTSNESDINNAFKYSGGVTAAPKTELNYVRAIRAF